MDVNVDDDLEDLEDLIDNDNPPVVVAPVVNPTNDESLAKASWQNVVALLETQNAMLTKKLENVEPALNELREQAAACKAAADKCSNKVEELETLKAQLPDDVNTEITEEIPAADNAPQKKKGFFTKR